MSNPVIESKNKNKKKCRPNYYARATESGSAYVMVDSPPSLVTSEASATAQSNISYKDAFIKARNIAQNIADGVAQNNANIITQSLLLSKQSGLETTGATGPVGPQGSQGVQGSEGSQGFTGSIGWQGFQ